MKSTNLRYLIPCILLLVASCTKDINVNLNDVTPQIVIAGEVNNAAGPYLVRITKTVNFSASNTFPAVSGATVKITDSTSGQTDILLETSSGVYTTQTLSQGTPGHTYQLYVSVGGQTYTAISTMPQVVPLDSVTFEHKTDVGGAMINAVPDFQDPFGVANYYSFTEHINNKLFNKAIFVFDDRLSDGRYITNPLSMDSAYLKRGDTLQLEMRCVDKKTYHYFNEFASILDASNFQSAAPANPVSNISNNSLGYFSANTVQTKTVVVY